MVTRRSDVVVCPYRCGLGFVSDVSVVSRCMVACGSDIIIGPYRCSSVFIPDIAVFPNRRIRSYNTIISDRSIIFSPYGTIVSNGCIIFRSYGTVVPNRRIISSYIVVSYARISLGAGREPISDTDVFDVSFLV